MRRVFALAFAALLLCACRARPEQIESETEGAVMYRILCIGDSNTYGFDPRNFGGQYAADERWTGLLARDDREIINWGVNGATIPTDAALRTLVQAILAQLPLHGMIVMLGTNDILCGDSATACAQHMQTLLQALQEAAPQARLLLIAPPPTPLGDASQRAAFASAYRELAESYQTLAAQLQIAFADAGAWDIALGADELHFSVQGHADFAASVSPMLDQLCQEETP